MKNKKNNFLDNVYKDKKEEQLVKEIQEKKAIINNERMEIGNLLEELVSKDLFTNIDIIEKVNKVTNFSKSTIRNMLEEYKFRKEYDLSPNFLDLIEIRQIKKELKLGNLKKTDIIEDIKLKEKLKELALDNQEVKFSHNIVFDEDAEYILEESKKICEKRLNRKIKSKSELFNCILVDFYINAQSEMQEDIEF